MATKERGNKFMRLEVDGEYPTIAIPVSEYGAYRLKEIERKLSALDLEINAKQTEFNKLFLERAKLEEELEK